VRSSQPGHPGTPAPDAQGNPAADEELGIRPVRFNHVAFRVRDVQRSLDFYEGVLGFREAFRVYHPDGRLGLIYVQFGADQFVELFEGGEGQRQSEPPADGSGYLHFCLTVEDLDAALDALRARGVPAGEARTGTSGARICFISDPDGNRIELAELNATSQTRQAAARARWLARYGEG
jgi:lactoylglutathione lyase